ncbi:hypothetical protein Poly24_20800 [Rosistilla carotiformis]|uniref:Uncharacterized protein n=1 Tax=Rosistilla carotiformis TaxID=2528017 RepID=A0A518JS41_9BACT|nr:hypothetical protein Poly24_20800 [Rosistilla carotiformis]
MIDKHSDVRENVGVYTRSVSAPFFQAFAYGTLECALYPLRFPR